jgi:PRC-barrel domain
LELVGFRLGCSSISISEEVKMTVAARPEVTARETTRLIASDKVEGAAVRRSDGEKLGSIKRVMIDKLTGKVAYAVMTFGGFLGIGDEYRAVPWSVLRYSPDLDAYELDATEDQLRNAPVLATGWEAGEINRDWERDIHEYYRTSPYW